jgi:hypothetical protein
MLAHIVSAVSNAPININLISPTYTTTINLAGLMYTIIYVINVLAQKK